MTKKYKLICMIYLLKLFDLANVIINPLKERRSACTIQSRQHLPSERKIHGPTDVQRAKRRTKQRRVRTRDPRSAPQSSALLSRNSATSG